MTTKTKAGSKKFRTFSLARIMRASEDYNGFCLACGHEQECCEPDAREYRCDSCGERQVYGAEELVLMGRSR
jgi:hypothetical protein